MFKQYLEYISKEYRVIVWISGKFNIIHDGHKEFFSETFKQLKPLNPEFYLGSSNEKYVDLAGKKEMLKAFDEALYVCVPKGSEFNCYNIKGQDLWYDDGEDYIHEMSNDWAKQNIIRIKKTK